MGAGIIPYANVPHPIPDGLFLACEAALVAAGFSATVALAPDGIHVADVSTVTATMTSYAGSAAELAYHKAIQQAALDAIFSANFDLAAFIRSGTTVGITGVQVGTFLATITNNYRTLRAAIANATTVAQISAINVTAGWPNNP